MKLAKRLQVQYVLCAFLFIIVTQPDLGRCENLTTSRFRSENEKTDNIPLRQTVVKSTSSLAYTTCLLDGLSSNNSKELIKLQLLLKKAEEISAPAMCKFLTSNATFFSKALAIQSMPSNFSSTQCITESILQCFNNGDKILKREALYFMSSIKNPTIEVIDFFLKEAYKTFRGQSSSTLPPSYLAQQYKKNTDIKKYMISQLHSGSYDKRLGVMYTFLFLGSKVSTVLKQFLKSPSTNDVISGLCTLGLLGTKGNTTLSEIKYLTSHHNSTIQSISLCTLAAVRGTKNRTQYLNCLKHIGGLSAEGFISTTH